ncbi:type I pantothenate kinase [Fructobacillus sp. CRL 2054]|uniref:type I pantothenate kinase n=1 Tax=Fructobacillus sp. CRL 2054 TaxID=2763007 RepID=UPI00237911AB|nr:type I pantothenate kinase [Fructobacillus sp. CRL 2054]MDD9138134.1 type I pantothenate kinase [Fructobacillus sp. CRL 2054]
MLNQLISQIKKAQNGSFFTIGLTGSVAVGKSTLAERLAVGLRESGLKVEVLSTDAFLKDNATLHEEGIFDEKGFPKSYDLTALEEFIRFFQDGKDDQKVAVYSQTLADIVPSEKKRVKRPDVLILEGVVALQLPEDLLNSTIFLEADMAHVKDWYLERNLLATVKSANHPDSWRAQYAKLPLIDFYNLAMSIWEKTNQKNYDDYIYPSQQSADWIVALDYYHQITEIKVGPRQA